MEKKSRTNTMESSPPSPQEAAASLDPLVQSITDHDDEPVYLRRQSSLFYIPAGKANGHEDETIGGKKRNLVEKWLAYANRCSGILYALLASFLFSCSNFVMVQLVPNLVDVLVVRFSVLAMISFGFILYKGYSFHPGPHGVLLLFRSVFAAVGSVSFYLAVSYIPFPDLTTVRYTQVVWTALLALVVFRERLTPATIIASVLTLIGVVCVAQPTFLFASRKPLNATSADSWEDSKNKRFIGMLIAFTCALAISLSIVLNKKLLQKKARQSLIMFYFQVITSVAALLFQTYYWAFSQSKTREFNFRQIYLTRNFFLASLISILQLCPMILSQKAIKREHPSIVTVVQSSDIIFAIVLQNTFTAVKTNPVALVGSALVITSIFIVGGYKLWLDRQSRTCLPVSAPECTFPTENKP